MADDDNFSGILSTSTTTKAVKIGSRGEERIICTNTSSIKQAVQHGYVNDWSSGREQIDGNKAPIEEMSRSSTSCRRLTDQSQALNEFEEDTRSVTSERSNRSTTRSLGSNRSRFKVDLFTDDFDETMNRCIGDFNSRFHKSLWRDDDNDSFFSRSQNSFFGDDEFFSRPKLTHKTRRNITSSFFDSILDDFGKQKRSNPEEEYAESGVFSDGTSSRLSQNMGDDTSFEKPSQVKKSFPEEKFEVDMNVHGYKANELLVRTEGRRLMISARKKDEEGNPVEGSKELKREFMLPEGVDPYKVTSNLLPNGFLKVVAPLGTPQAKSQSETT